MYLSSIAPYTRSEIVMTLYVSQFHCPLHTLRDRHDPICISVPLSRARARRSSWPYMYLSSIVPYTRSEIVMTLYVSQFHCPMHALGDRHDPICISVSLSPTHARRSS